MATPGRPTLKTEDKIKTALKLASEGLTIKAICKFLEIDKKTYYNWTYSEPKLKEAMDKEIAAAKQKEMEKVKRSLYKLTQNHSLVTKKEFYNAEGELESYVVETKKVDANVSAITAYLDRNEEKHEDADNKLIIKIED